jgi:hypothetical protein
MVAKVLRVALFSGLMLALWSFARPAHAATLAPFCDDRGATALAPPPALEPIDEAVRRAATPPAADGDGPSFVLTLRPGHRLARAALVDMSPASVPNVTTGVVPPSAEPLAATRGELLSPAGVRFRVERPPRG